MEKRTLKIFNVMILAGAVLLIASFFMKVADITIEGQGYYATALNLARGQVVQDYHSGVGGLDYFVEIRAYFPEFVGLIIFGFMTFPIVLAKKDNVPRYLGVLFGILGPACAFFGYYDFINTNLDYIIPNMAVTMGYGLWVGMLAGVLVIVGNGGVILGNIREPRPSVLDETTDD